MVLDTSFQSTVIKCNNITRLTTSLSSDISFWTLKFTLSLSRNKFSKELVLPEQKQYVCILWCEDIILSTWGAEAGLSPERGRRRWCLSGRWRRGQSTRGRRRGRSPASQGSVAHGQWGRAVPVVRLRVVVVVPALLMTRLHLKVLKIVESVPFVMNS